MRNLRPQRPKRGVYHFCHWITLACGDFAKSVSTGMDCVEPRNWDSMQQAPFTQKDTGRARARARCKCGGVNQVANNAK